MRNDAQDFYKNSCRGSTLVGAVILALVLAISGATYLWVVRHAGVQDADALRDTRAIYAAESGLLLATRALRASGLPSASQTWIISSDSRIKVNGLWVDVEVVDAYSSSSFFGGSSSSALGVKKINARAYDAPTGGTFLKRISWTVRELVAFEFGYFSNGLSNNGEGELCGNSFWGDTYLTAKTSGQPFNPVCTDTVCTKYYGKLNISASQMNLSGNGHCNMDSSEIKNGDAPLYRLLQAPVIVPDSYQDMAKNIRSSSSANKIVLPASVDTLIFSDDGTASYAGVSLGNIDGKIIQASSPIFVRGKVKGNVTVVSGASQKITVKDSLTYADLVHTGASAPNPPTSISSTSSNYLGLVSDGGVALDNKDKAISVSAAIIAWRDGATGLEMTAPTNHTHPMLFTGIVLQAKSSPDLRPILFVQDVRLKGHAPPGFPPPGMQDNLFKYEITNWEESSVQ